MTPEPLEPDRRAAALAGALPDKDVLISRRPERVFVSGEGFDYLGRRYRLKVTDEEDLEGHPCGGPFSERVSRLN